MDNLTVSLFRQIIRELRRINKLSNLPAHDVLSPTVQTHINSEANKSKTNNDKSQVKPELPPIPGTFPDAPPTTESDKKTCTTDKPWFKLLKAGVEVIGVVAVVWYTIIASHQHTAMVDANKINGDALTSVQRAFVVSQGTRNSQFVLPDKSNPGKGNPFPSFGFFCLVENTGATPARGIEQAFAGGDISPDEPSEKQFIEAPHTKAFVIGPKSQYQIGRIVRSLPFFVSNLPLAVPTPNNPIVKDVSGHRVFFWGWISYEDVFFPRTAIHVTEWCEMVSQLDGRADTSGTKPKITFDFTFQYCQRHNCVDEDCEDYAQVAAIQNR